jgi:hypothetical protein
LVVGAGYAEKGHARRLGEEEADLKLDAVPGLGYGGGIVTLIHDVGGDVDEGFFNGTSTSIAEFGSLSRQLQGGFLIALRGHGWILWSSNQILPTNLEKRRSFSCGSRQSREEDICFRSI